MGTVYLRPLELTDLDRTFRWHNDPKLYELLVSPFRHVSRTAEEEWIRKKMQFSNAELQLAICLTEGQEHIGNIHLRNIDWMSRTAETGVFIGESKYWSKGYGGQAMRLLLRHAFNDLGLLRVWLTVFDDNVRAIRSYEKCGFVVEGTLRKHAFKLGRFKNLVYMGINVDDPGTAWVREPA
jgi:RimJ/RimL family protein N-acetyltransferase